MLGSRQRDLKNFELLFLVTTLFRKRGDCFFMIDGDPEWYQVFKLQTAKLSRKRRAPLHAAIALLTGSWDASIERVFLAASGEEGIFCECCLSFLSPKRSEKRLHYPNCLLAAKAHEVLNSIDDPCERAKLGFLVSE